MTHNRQWLQIRLQWRLLGVSRTNTQTVLLERLSLQPGNQFLQYLWGEMHHYGIWLQYPWRAWVSTLLQTGYVICWAQDVSVSQFHPCYFGKAVQYLPESGTRQNMPSVADSRSNLLVFLFEATNELSIKWETLTFIQMWNAYAEISGVNPSDPFSGSIFNPISTTRAIHGCYLCMIWFTRM